MGLGGGDAQLETKFISGPNPAKRNIAGPISNKSDNLTFYGAAQLLIGKNVGNNLAGMFIVSQRVNGEDIRSMGKLFHVILGKGANYCAVYHSAKHSSCVLYWFTASKL